MLSSTRVLSPKLIRSLRCPQVLRSFSNSPNPTPRTEFPSKSSTDRSPIFPILLRYGFPQSQLQYFIQNNPFLLNFAPRDVQQCIQLLSSLKLPQNVILSIVSACPRALELGFTRKWVAAFSNIAFCDLSPILVQRVLEQAGKLRLKPTNFLPAVQVFQNLGLSVETVTAVLAEVPLVSLLKNYVDFESQISFLKVVSAIKSNNEIDRVCRRFPEFFMLSLSSQLKPLFREIQDLGFSREEVKNVLLEEPRMFLTMEVGELFRYMDLLNSLKCRMPIMERILSKGRAMACLDVKTRIEFLCRHGLIRRDAFKILFIEPRIIIYPIEDIEKKIDFLMQKLGFHVEYLIDCPEYLGVNLEKHIIPRYEVIEYLRSQGGLGFNVGMKHFVKFSKLRFYNMFVKPYPECQKIFNGSNKEEVKSQQSTGLWKLFEPQKFPNTIADVKNMKLFMETIQ